MKLEFGSVSGSWFLPVLAALTFGTPGCSTANPTPSGAAATIESSGAESNGADDDSHRSKPPLPDLTRYVDAFIGTAKAPNVTHPVGGGSGGSVFPGASLPWGGIAFSPDTPTGEPSGYAYEDAKITGFSLTHFSGAGCPNG